jgi:hypothetical protein
MTTRPLAALTFLFSAVAALHATDAPPAKNGRLLFHDDFNGTKVGANWNTNDGKKDGVGVQSRLADGALVMQTAPQADHGAVINTDVAFRDAALEVRFQLMAAGTDAFNFVINDKACKTVHAGHIARATVRPAKITLQDDKTGQMNLEVQARIAKEGRTPDLVKLLAAAQKPIDQKITPGVWHVLRVEIRGDEMRAFYDGKFIGSLRSPGFAHATKSNFGFTTGKTEMRFNEVNVWALE